jgi:hypothetical protein
LNSGSKDCSGSAFPDLIRRVRAGDAHAAAELFRQYELLLRLEVRLRLRDPRLRRLFDEADVCQSVLKSFFVRARLGQHDLAEPGALARLLAGMARNKVAAQARKQRVALRDFRRAEELTGAKAAVAAGDTPARWRLGRNWFASSAPGWARRSGASPTCGPRAASGRRSPPSWAEPPTPAACSSDGPSSGLRMN